MNQHTNKGVELHFSNKFNIVTVKISNGKRTNVTAYDHDKCFKSPLKFRKNGTPYSDFTKNELNLITIAALCIKNNKGQKVKIGKLKSGELQINATGRSIYYTPSNSLGDIEVGLSGFYCENNNGELCNISQSLTIINNLTT